MSIQALIFDCDGLLVDTETPDFRAWEQVYQEHGTTLLPERWMNGLGTFGGFDPHAELEALTGRSLVRDTLWRDVRQRYERILSEQPLLPGVRELLEAAQTAGLRIALASSSERWWVNRILTRYQIGPFFECVRTRDDVAKVKPAPDLFLSAAACLGVAPECCVVLEDSPNGMRAAAAAGMRCVAVPIALLAEAELPPVALRLGSLADITLPALLEQLATTP
ncbi:MAG: HAD family hydrolase [Roseiflexaceae bacterium]